MRICDALRFNIYGLHRPPYVTQLEDVVFLQSLHNTCVECFNVKELQWILALNSDVLSCFEDWKDFSIRIFFKFCL